MEGKASDGCTNAAAAASSSTRGFCCVAAWPTPGPVDGDAELASVDLRMPLISVKISSSLPLSDGDDKQPQENVLRIAAHQFHLWCLLVCINTRS